MGKSIKNLTVRCFNDCKASIEIIIPSFVFIEIGQMLKVKESAKLKV